MILKHVTNGDGSHYGYRFDCPGCKDPHVIPTKPHERGWDFNGDEARPTFAPSILVRYTPGDPNDKNNPASVCHSFVRGGQIQFLADCTHALAGQTVPLPEIPTPTE